MQQDGNNRAAHLQSTCGDDALRRLREEKHRIDTLYHTIETQLTVERAALTGGDVCMVLGHMTRGGDSLKEAADYLNGISSMTHAHGGVTEQAVFTEVFKKLTEVCLTIMELGEADTCGTSDMMHHTLDMSDPECALSGA
ncbi:unnamed protein product [Vitrella brassicaformis CCMP3155]|uniref:Uncharacterized protein n=1 Tax=Vitrella brassicaformis (strain CCMP3155) TaxID=1169540 RepID=A0A0G4GMN7_VITBC|nr:unnamed protein product [Vitrella brassicaformis CCMP3155]|eukprot:CEM31459.1 unnamed protein product [Vitrella brassicaformis CCMP3155]